MFEGKELEFIIIFIVLTALSYMVGYEEAVRKCREKCPFKNKA